MPRRCARTSMASIHQACGRMVARRTGTRRTPVSAGMLAASAALLSALSPNRRAPAGRTYAGSCTGVRSCIPAGRICTRPYALAAGGGPDAHAIRRTSPVSPRTPRRIRARRLPTAPGAHTTADRQGESIDDEPVARGDAPPTFAGIQAIQSASGWRRRWKRETPIRSDR